MNANGQIACWCHYVIEILFIAIDEWMIAKQAQRWMDLRMHASQYRHRTMIERLRRVNHLLRARMAQQHVHLLYTERLIRWCCSNGPVSQISLISNQNSKHSAQEKVLHVKMHFIIIDLMLEHNMRPTESIMRNMRLWSMVPDGQCCGALALVGRVHHARKHVDNFYLCFSL